MLTDQELFDKVSTHLLTQMEKATDGEGDCAYRGENGLKCAIGCLIDDKWYNRNFEGCVPDSRYLGEIGGLSYTLARNVSENLDLMHDLQQVHDAYDPDEWKEMLADVARTHHLQGPI